jgi:xyloglucan:xyloglucosyl transferase
MAAAAGSFVSFLAVFAAAACLSAAAMGDGEPPLSFGEGYTQLFGDSNLALHGDGKRVHITLDERTGLRLAVLGVRSIDAVFCSLLILFCS